jgi:hypothetical protein
MRDPVLNIRERMVLFWSNHFVVEALKVRAPQYLYDLLHLFRLYALGNVKELTKAVGKAPAMLIYLDGVQNRAGNPNENYARELLELFTMGIGHYTEPDVKEAARAFLKEAPKGLRVGLVAFSGYAQTVHPPTADRRRLLESLQSLEFGRSTAIGEGILEALRQIREAGGKGEVLLLTDGRNRTGVDPLEAAGEAARMGVPIYAVGVGVPGWTPGPEDLAAGLGFFAGAYEVDEELLWAIAELTGGKNFLVRSEKELSRIYLELAKEVRLEVRPTEATGLLGALGGMLALLGVALRRYLSPL